MITSGKQKTATIRITTQNFSNKKYEMYDGVDEATDFDAEIENWRETKGVVVSGREKVKVKIESKSQNRK